MKLALVVQRYGDEVIGGAELLARELAKRLAPHHRVEVITTCAKDHFSWADYFTPGLSTEAGVQVRRFPVKKQRNWNRFGRWSQLLFAANRRRALPTWLGEKWVTYQGPFVPGLIDYLDRKARNFDVLVFFTYLYYPTVFGLRCAPAKSVLIPTAHDEPAIRLKVFAELFQLPSFLVFMTVEERDLVTDLLGHKDMRHQTIGVGITIKEPCPEEAGYFFYAGRIESGKNCQMMFDYCQRAGVALKVAGPTRTAIPDHVEYLGVLSEAEKEKYLNRCRAVILPSAMESLSIIALEAWACGKPVIAWDESPVLKGQIIRSGGGYCFSDLEEFRKITEGVDPQRGLLGWEYVRQNYSWDIVLPRYEQVFQRVANQTHRQNRAKHQEYDNGR